MIDTSKIHISSNYGVFKIVKYTDAENVLIEFISTGYQSIVQAGCVVRGNVKDRLAPSVFSVGFLGEGIYKVSINCKLTKQYRVWVHMLERCYCPKRLDKYPTYIGCTVSDEWHNFQVFAAWFDDNYIDGYHLDKDIKIKGNKCYSPDACSFVTAKENTTEALAKNFRFINPKGVLVELYNLKEFCKGNSLDYSSMSRVHSGQYKQSKGWRAVNQLTGVEDYV